MPFSTYQERDDRRRKITGGLLVGAGLALLVPGVRRRASQLLLGGAERLGSRFAQTLGPSRVEQTAAELTNLFDRSVPRSAQAATARRTTATFLTDYWARTGGTTAVTPAARAALNAGAARVVESSAFRGFLFGGKTEEFLAHDTVTTLLEERVAARLRLNPNLLKRETFEQEQAFLRRAALRGRQAMPAVTELAENEFYQDVNRQLGQLTKTELERQAGWRQSRGARIARLFGIEAVTLGELAEAERRAHVFGTHRDLIQQFGAFTDPTTAARIPIGGVYKVGDRTFDLRGAEQTIFRAKNWLQGNLQIPLLPGKDGISPLQLFPWTHGQVDRTFSHIASHSTDPTLAGLFGRTGERIGDEVFKVGRQFAAVDWEGETYRGLAEPGGLRSGLYGYAKRRAETITAAQAARAEGSPGGVAEWLGLTPEQFRQSPFGSIWGKFKPGSEWAPTLTRRLLTIDPEQATAGEVRRIGRYLTKRGLAGTAQETIAAHGAAKFSPHLQPYVANLGSDDAVLEFFQAAVGDQGARFHTDELNELIAQYRANPRGLLNRFEPAERHSFLGFNLPGDLQDRRGIDLMRAGILGEAATRINLLEGEDAVASLLRNVQLSGAEQDQAFGYLQGQSLLRRLKTTRGAAGATEWLQGNATAQMQVERAMGRRTRWWHQYQPPGEGLGTTELFGRDPVSFLTEINRARTAGQSWLHSFWSTVTGPWGRQYAATLTGNQADATVRTAMLEHLPRTLESKFAGAGLGLPARDLLSGGSIAKNLFLKRILPAVGAVEAYRYADYAGDKLGIGGPSDAYANVRARLGRSRAKHFGKQLPLLGRRALFPGLDMFLPERDEAEEARHQESGYEPVRRGRFWSDGSRASFWGDKVDYFLPSAVRVARSHWQGAENADQNTGDYWKHSWIPNPNNLFLGPLAWLWNPYWWEEKHAKDRPYVISGEMSDPNTPHGGVVNATLGRLLKPRRVMHPEYLPKSLGGSASREQLRAINEAQRAGLDMQGAGLLAGSIGGGGGAGGHGAGGTMSTPGVTPGGGDGGSLAQITPAGQLAPLSYPGGTDATALAALGRSSIQKEGYGQRLSRAEVARLNRLTKSGAGGLARQRPSELLQLRDQRDPFAEEQLDLLNYQSGTVAGLKNLSDLGGLYGYFARLGLEAGGHPLKQPGVQVASPNRAYGWARRWYDLGLGGLGGELNEVGRRFLTHPQKIDLYNPVPNRMPGWLPGPEGLVDFRHGDPYTKIARGELRLPGEAYERVHDIRLMHTRASSIGKTVGELMQEMLSLQTPMSGWGEQVTQTGTEMHHALQSRWRRMGVLLAGEERLENRELGISGHYDAILAMRGGPLLVDIKTVSAKRFAEARRQPYAEHVSQLNFYLHETGMRRGGLLYINRDDPRKMKMQRVGIDHGEFQRSLGRVDQARQTLLNLVDQGVLSRGDLYDPVSRLEVLADVAPYSPNYAQVRDYLTQQKADEQLSEPENQRFQAAKARVAQQKKRLNLYPYRFRGSDLRSEWATVDRVLDANSFSIEGDDRPIKLAGVTASGKRIEALGQRLVAGRTPEEVLYARLGVRRGRRVRLEVEGDPMRETSRDTRSSRHAVVYTGAGNVNRRLLDSGAAEEKANDFSDTGVAARFTPGERRRGAWWEAFAHLDTPFHSKFLKVRSPLEELERGIVFGKATGGWAHPGRDYLWPTVTSYASKNPLIAAGAGGLLAQLFFRKTAAKKVAFLAGAAVMGGLALARWGAEQATGEIWKPARTRKREELEEYWDTLKYTKYRALAAHEEKLAKSDEGVDVDRMTRELYSQGQGRTRRRRWLEKLKRLADRSPNPKEHAGAARLQEEISELREARGMLKLGPHATRALQYRELYRSTLYSIQPGETPFLNLFRAFPKYKRELLDGFINKSNKKERQRIFQLLPAHEQRVLGHYLGIKGRRVPKRPELKQYFQDRPLPDADWQGWRPEVDMEQLRQVAIHREGLDPMESGLYPQQIEQAERLAETVPVPTVRGSQAAELRERLTALLSGKGLSSLNVQVEVAPHDDEQLHVDMKIRKRREGEIRDALHMQRR